MREYTEVWLAWKVWLGVRGYRGCQVELHSSSASSSWMHMQANTRAPPGGTHLLEEGALVAEEEGEEQGADVGAVHVSIRQDDDLAGREGAIVWHAQ